MSSTFLRRVRITNFRSIAHCDVALSPLTLLVGPNGAGKSNFIDAIRFVRDARIHGPSTAVSKRELGLSGVLRTGQESFTIGMDLSDGLYELTVGRGSDDLSDSVEYRRPSECRDLARMQFYSPDVDAMRQITALRPGDLLAESAANGADVLYQLASRAPEALTRINDYLRAIVPSVQAVRVEALAELRVLTFDQLLDGGSKVFRAAHMSDGTLRALAILIALFQRSDAPLIAIEEPETGLHPSGAALMLDAMLEASLTTQILATSHSPELLDRKDIPEDSILSVTSESGETRIAPLSAASRSALRDGLCTAGELMRMGQLNPDPE